MVWLCVDYILFLSFFDPGDILEGQEGLALKVISFQFVIVVNGHNQAGPGSQALIQRHHAAATSSQSWTLERDRRDTQDLTESQNLQLKHLIKQGIEVAAFNLGAAGLHHGKNVVRFQSQLHKWITEA